MVTEIIGLTEEIKGRTVVIIEDIVDTGATLEKLVDLLSKKNVNQIKIASLLFKPEIFDTTKPTFSKSNPFTTICVPTKISIRCCSNNLIKVSCAVLPFTASTTYRY